MDLNVVYASFCDELEKIKLASELTEAAREHIKSKNFAISAKQSDTGKPAYPIEDKRHAANALARVKQFGSPSEKAEVYKDVARKYPEMAAKSDVPAVHSKLHEKRAAEDKTRRLPMDEVKRTAQRVSECLRSRGEALHSKLHEKRGSAFADEMLEVLGAKTAGMGTTVPVGPAGTAAAPFNGLNKEQLMSGIQQALNRRSAQIGGPQYSMKAAASIKDYANAALHGASEGAGLAADEMYELKTGSALEHATELAGLGVLAVPGVDTLQAKMRSRNDPEHWKKKLMLGEGAHAAADVGGLGILAAPEVSKLLRR